jgi:lysophospholipase L1-like esterase
MDNIKNWGNLFYNVANYGIVPGIDVTVQLQTLVNIANAENRSTIVLNAGVYTVTDIANDDNIVYFGDGASFTGGYSKVINDFSDLLDFSERLDDAATKIELEAKADISYVNSQDAMLDTKISSVASGSPKGTYATLSALQSAFPTGNTNIYVVTSNGNWYYWNGSAWTSGGVYQSSVLADNSVTPAKTTFFSELTSPNIFNKDTITTPGIVASNNGTIVTGGGAVNYLASDFIPVSPSKTYYTTFSYDGAWYNSSQVYISGFTGTPQARIITPPAGAAFLRITFALAAKDTAMVAADALPTSYEPYGTTLNFKTGQYAEDIADQLSPYITAPSKWSGKTWNVIGDSITEHNNKTSQNYQDYISAKIGCVVNNYGISGTGWRTPSVSGGTNAFYQRVSSFAAGADLITVFGGVNDWYQVGTPFVMGSFGDTDPAISFYGAVNSVITQLITKYPTKIIAVFTPIPCDNNWGTNSAGVTLDQIAEAIITVSKHYSLPVLDLYRHSNVYAWDASYKAYAMPDGLHLNDNGHKALADKILAFLNAL